MKRVQAQEPRQWQSAFYMKQKALMQLQKSQAHRQNPYQIHSVLKDDVYTAEKNRKQDDSQHMESSVTNVASSTILNMHAEVPGAVWSTPLKRKLYTNKSMAS